MVTSIKKGMFFKAQFENIVILIKILDVYKNKFIVLDLVQLSPNKLTQPSIVWPISSLKQLEHIQVISEEQYSCMCNVMSPYDQKF